MSVRVESPFPSWAWPRVWLWQLDFRARVADDFAPANVSDFVVDCLRRERARKSWAVFADEELCGLVTFEASSPVVGSSSALFRKDYWGPDVAAPALRLVYGEIFAGTHTRIETSPFRDCNAIISLAVAVGAKREGVLRRRAMRGGRLVDVAVMGLLKEDFTHVVA